LLSGTSRKCDEVEKIKVACIGAGYFAAFHAEAWKRLPGVELTGICDRDGARARALAERFSAAGAYDNLEELLRADTPRIVDIITPPDTHLKLVDQVAAPGRWIVCQKPMAPTLAEAEAMTARAEAAGAVLLIHENFRYQPWHQKMKALIEAGAIGEQLLHIEARVRLGDGWPDDAYLDRQPYFRLMPRLFVYETGIHYIDLFRFYAGEIRRVYAQLRRYNANIQGEDAALVILESARGCLCLLNASRYHECDAPEARYTFGDWRLEGDGGALWLDTSGDIFLKKLGQAPEPVSYAHADVNFCGDSVYFTQQAIVESIRGGLPYPNTARVYLANIRAQEAIYESAARGEAVRLP
jgi:predicted dehydrogenase